LNVLPSSRACLFDGCLVTRTPSSYKRVGSGPISNYIDLGVFNQVLELDEEGDEDLFSKDMVDAYFIQAEKTFEDMDTALCAFATSSASSA
jgi:hypothetical protein